MTAHDLIPFASSLAIGLLLGFERERSHAVKVRQMAGSRTFALLALCGTLAATIHPWVTAAGLLAVGALVAVGYRTTSSGDPGATTEVAALITYLLGALAESDSGLAAALAILVIVLLSAKDRIHSFARDAVTDADVEDAVKFLVMAFVVLPLLPDRNVGPYGVLNLERIWQLVLALTGISWAGYLATRVLGPRRGLVIAGLAGGFISASATTMAMARQSRSTGQLRVALAGAYLASVATFVQLSGIIWIADPHLVVRLWPALVAGGLTLAAIASASTARHRPLVSAHGITAASLAPTDHEPEQAATRPFGLRPALLLATVLTIALLVGRWVVDMVGPRATMLASGAAGLADAHAGALAAATLHEQGQVGMSMALLGVGAAVVTNTLVKCVLAFVVGGRRFGWRFAVGLVPAVALFAGAIVIAAATA